MAEVPASGPSHSGDFDEHWRQVLTGESVPGLSGLFRRLPSPPRCKACGAPFAGPYAPLLRLLGFRPWGLNEQLCRWCHQGVGRQRGGAEIPVSLLFTDIRGSTSLAEQRTATEFRGLLDRFFGAVFHAVDDQDGVIDHIVGDGVMAMWTPAVAGDEHWHRAVAAGRTLVRTLTSDAAVGGTIPAGVGLHTGIAWVGVVGEGGVHDFTVVGDAANTVARLGSVAGAGQLVMSDAIVDAAHLDTEALDRRVMRLKGKETPVTVWIEAQPTA